MVSDEQVVSKLRELLNEVDLEKTTERQLRQTLEKDFGEDLSDRRGLIRAEIERYLNGEGDKEDSGDDNDGFEAELTAELEDPGDTDEPAKKKRKAGGPTSMLSPALADVVGAEAMKRTEVVKKLWEYIKEHSLQDPKNKRNILLDDKLSKVFTSPLTMFTMNKQLSKHIYSSAGSESSVAPAPKKKKTEKTDETAPKKKTGFNRPIPVSDQLAEWMGKSEIPRHELTSFFWSYVKENGLQDPKNGQNIICDEKLKQLTGQDKLKGFGFMKFFSHHFVKD